MTWPRKGLPDRGGRSAQPNLDSPRNRCGFKAPLEMSRMSNSTFLVAALVLFPVGLVAQPAPVELTPAKTSVTAGDTVRFLLTVKDGSGQTIRPQSVVWSVAPFDIGAADSTGLVRTFRQGSALVFAVVAGKAARAV